MNVELATKEEEISSNDKTYSYKEEKSSRNDEIDSDKD